MIFFQAEVVVSYSPLLKILFTIYVKANLAMNLTGQSPVFSFWVKTQNLDV